jgi:16S rRNA pseudouridine516 synthase
MRLDSLLAKRLGLGSRGARDRITSGSVTVDGNPESDHRREISRFERVECGGVPVQAGRERLHLMLHKPAGILSATSDPVHRTVLDLIDHPDKATLHLAGRLDRTSTGLVLLSNDGHWSGALTLPGNHVEKSYLVETDRAIPQVAVDRFAEGFFFATENLVTKPARLELLSERRARVTLSEGRYHQIKRMFHRIDGIRLVSLHRDRVGPYELPDDLAPGEWRRIDPFASVTPVPNGND